MSSFHIDIDELFAPCLGVGPVALAVSGGGDSMALMHLFARWRKAHPHEVSGIKDLVCSVDHGLRAEAADEVAMVMREAERLGFEAVSLKLEGFASGASLQARGREARYSAMRDRMKKHGLGHLLTAHTADDQAETFFMRLKRGSGIDGLCGIMPERSLFGVQLLRPLLGVRGIALRDWLKTEDVEWAEDPSNKNENFERVKIRRLLQELDDDGSFTQKIGETVRRLQRGRVALEETMLEYVCGEVQVHRIGALRLSVESFSGLAFEVQVRVMGRLLRAFGAERLSLSSLEGGVFHLLSMGPEKYVLGGVLCEKDKKGLFCFSRETARSSLEVLTVPSIEEDLMRGDGQQPERCVIWDRRVELVVPVAIAGEVQVRGFERDEIKELRASLESRGIKISFLPEFLSGVAGCWHEGRLVSVPQLELSDEHLLLQVFGKGDDLSPNEVFQRAIFPLKGWDKSHLSENGLKKRIVY